MINFAWYEKRWETIHYWSFTDLKKIEGNFTTWRNEWNGKHDFVRLNATWLKDGIYAVTSIDTEILMYIELYILVKATFVLVGIQQSG